MINYVSLQLLADRAPTKQAPAQAPAHLRKEGKENILFYLPDTSVAMYYNNSMIATPNVWLIPLPEVLSMSSLPLVALYSRSSVIN
jgi:hypothetical protein